MTCLGSIPERFQDKAMNIYVVRVNVGRPLTDAQVGEDFGKSCERSEPTEKNSPTWYRDSFLCLDS